MIQTYKNDSLHICKYHVSCTRLVDPISLPEVMTFPSQSHIILGPSPLIEGPIFIIGEKVHEEDAA